MNSEIVPKSTIRFVYQEYPGAPIVDTGDIIITESGETAMRTNNITLEDK